jgi:hypothetical protein
LLLPELREGGVIPKISPHPSLKKRGEFFITFPSPSFFTLLPPFVKEGWGEII